MWENLISNGKWGACNTIQGLLKILMNTKFYKEFFIPENVVFYVMYGIELRAQNSLLKALKSSPEINYRSH